MKVKQHIFITNKADFLRGDYRTCFNLDESPDLMADTWEYVGEIEFEVNVDTDNLVSAVTSELTAEIGKHTAAINVLENRKADLLSITHDKSFSQQDRVLANGDIKTSTGEILEPTCRTADDCRDSG